MELKIGLDRARAQDLWAAAGHDWRNITNKSAQAPHGVIPALIFCNDEEGRISTEAIERQLSYLIDAGIDGIFVNGTTGEGAVLSQQERTSVFRAVDRMVRGRIPLYAVSLQPSTEAVIEEIKLMADLGASYAAAVAPYYYSADQEATTRHFLGIADASPLPLLIYDIPQNTHTPLRSETVLTLSAHGNIIGMKDSSGDFGKFHQVLLCTQSEAFACLQGDDMLDAAALSVGAPGMVTGLGNVRIEHYVEMYRAAKDGETDCVMNQQRRIYEIVQIIKRVGGKGIPAIKAGAELFGRGNRRMKIEGLTLTSEEVEIIKATLREVGALYRA